MKKKMVTICLVVALVLTAVAGGSLAYFTDTDNAENTFTSGNVKIVQNEKDRNGNDFVQGQKLLPIVNDGKDANGYHTGANYIDKIVTVTNTGNQDAYVRTHIAFPAVLDDGANTYAAVKNMLHWNGASANDTFGAANFGGTIENDWYWDKTMTTDWPGNGGDWNCYQADVEGVTYNVYVATHKSVVPTGATTAPSLFGVYLDKNVNYEDGYYVAKIDGKDYKVEEKVLKEAKILVVSEAVQAAGFDNAMDALDEAFGKVGSYNPFVAE